MAKKERERKQKREGNRLYFFKREISYKLANKKLSKQKQRHLLMRLIAQSLSSFRSSDARVFEILKEATPNYSPYSYDNVLDLLFQILRR
ncbi:unnamed protein product [Rhizophagus irregularis]|nr:unnamed protein product [Rhizophagus irregularis]